MKTFSPLIVALGLVCAAPLALACEGSNHGGHASKHFAEMDKNADGAITQQEFDAFHAAHFKEVDANHDGKITQDEMDAHHMKQMEARKENFRARFNQHFDESDANHDGGLSKEEASNMPMLSERFDEVDANHDGKISKEEIAAGMKKMHQNMQKRHEGGMQHGK